MDECQEVVGHATVTQHNTLKKKDSNGAMMHTSLKMSTNSFSTCLFGYVP